MNWMFKIKPEVEVKKKTQILFKLSKIKNKTKDFNSWKNW
jgi:hypothetical protein